MADNQDLINALAGNVSDERVRDPAWRNTLMQRYAPDFSGMNQTLADFLRQAPIALMGMGVRLPSAPMPGPMPKLGHGGMRSVAQDWGPTQVLVDTKTGTFPKVDPFEWGYQQEMSLANSNPETAYARGLDVHQTRQSFKPIEQTENQNLGSAPLGVPRLTGKYGSLPEEAGFRRLMGQQYEIARQSGDLSTMHDILGGRLINDRNMPPAMRQQMELEQLRLAREMGPEGRRMAGIPDPPIVEGQ